MLFDVTNHCPPLDGARWRGALVAALFACSTGAALAQGIAAKARESGCVDAPRVVEGAFYKCTTASGAAAYFNVPEPSAAEKAPPRRAGNTGANASPPANLPRVDAATQKGRDDLRRKVLQDELAAEEKLLAEARAAYANGAPSPLPEERGQPQRYAERIARLRQSVQLHERNIEALRKELGTQR
jgi:hypothetical protein